MLTVFDGVWSRQKAIFLVNPKAIAGFAVGIAGMFMCLTYVGLFAIPKHVDFSYADSTTCTGHLSFFPNLLKANDISKFNLEYRGGVSLNGVKLTSSKVCFVPTTIPAKGIVRVAISPYGGVLFKSDYIIAIGEAPQVLDTAPQTRALNQPLAIKINHPDKVFQYSLGIDGKAEICTMNEILLTCGVEKLGLKQGATYELKLQRTFNNRSAGETTGIQLMVMPAAIVTSTSIAPETTVYTKPKNADITLDHTLATAVAKLELVEGDTSTPITTRVKVEGPRVMLDWDTDLARDKTYRLTLTSATANDGSMLDSAYSYTFKTSGGPKVVGITIGDGAVAPGTKVIVTFDQGISKDSNVTGLAHITGGSAGITRVGANQVAFALGDIPRCGAFTLSVTKGLVSENGITSTQDWSQSSRINCRSTRTIGYSVNGRPIQAYFYGSGATTILYTGGIHGNEPSGMYIMQDWANYLDTNAYKIPANKQVVVVPSTNPDGIASNQRLNAHNVNIDRNFGSSEWIPNISVENGGILPLGGGSAPFSEPETRALADLTGSLHPRAEISFHSSGAIVGANKVGDSVIIGGQYARGVGYGTMFYNPETVMGYGLTGEYETWMGEKFGTPAILIELPNSTGRFFSRHLTTLWAMANL